MKDASKRRTITLKVARGEGGSVKENILNDLV